MNPELPEDWVEDALRSRAAMKAPPDFTRTVMRRVAAQPRFSPISVFVMEYGPHLGLTLAIMGLGVTLDVNRLGLLLQKSLQAASPVVVTVAGLCLTLLWWSATPDESI